MASLAAGWVAGVCFCARSRGPKVSLLLAGWCFVFGGPLARELLAKQRPTREALAGAQRRVHIEAHVPSWGACRGRGQAGLLDGASTRASRAVLERACMNSWDAWSSDPSSESVHVLSQRWRPFLS